MLTVHIDRVRFYLGKKMKYSFQKAFKNGLQEEGELLL